MKAILIANPKGDSGKSTLATNIAGYLASRGLRVALLDLDRQRSALLWLAQRSPGCRRSGRCNARAGCAQRMPIGWSSIRQRPCMARIWSTHLKLVHRVIVPIAPSLYDIQASYDFLRDLSEFKTQS